MTFRCDIFNVGREVSGRDILMLPLKPCSYHQVMDATHNPIFIPIPGPLPQSFTLSLTSFPLWFSFYIWPSFSLESSLTPAWNVMPSLRLRSSCAFIHPDSHLICELTAYSQPLHSPLSCTLSLTFTLSIQMATFNILCDSNTSPLDIFSILSSISSS